MADFGLARDVHIKDYYKQKSNGKIPVRWMAPETLHKKISNEKSDVVSEYCSYIHMYVHNVISIIKSWVHNHKILFEWYMHAYIHHAHMCVHTHVCTYVTYVCFCHCLCSGLLESHVGKCLVLVVPLTPIYPIMKY